MDSYLHLLLEVSDACTRAIVVVNVSVTNGTVQALQRANVLLQLLHSLLPVHLMAGRVQLSKAPLHHVLHPGSERQL